MKHIFLICSLVSMLFTSCGDPPEEATHSTGKLNIVTTIGMIGDVVKQVGGEHVEVVNLIGEGIDPHVYKHTAGDVKKLMAADVIFYNGLHLEGKMGDILSKLSSTGKPVFAVAEQVLSDNEVLQDAEGASDPHLWMDVSKWGKVALLVHNTLMKQDNANEKAYLENFEKYILELDLLDQYVTDSIATIPESQQELITAHDAFGYMENAYGLKVQGVQGISTESEAGLKDIETLIDYLQEKSIPAVFVESSVNDKSVRSLIEGAKAKGHTVTIGGELFSDAMGKAGTYEGTYIGMIDHNATTITRALGGEAPKGGMNGKLTH